MKFLSQMVLAIVAIVVLVAGVTYMSYYSTGVEKTKPGAVTPVAKGEKVELYMPQRIIPQESAGEFEVQSSGHYEFWFQNKSAVPVNLGVSYKSCKCSDLSVCVLSPEQTKSVPGQAGMSAAGEVSAGYLGVCGLLPLFHDIDKTSGWLGKQLNWQTITVDEQNGVAVGPESGGWFRIAFKGEKPSVARLSVNLWSQPNIDGPHLRTEYRLEIPVTFAPVLQLEPNELNMDELTVGEEKTRQFLCWSSTRSSFSLNVKESGNDPCFSCTTTPLSWEDCRNAEQKLRARVLAGYVVSVTARERLPNGAQLDWGPFIRRLTLSSDPDVEAATMEVRGRVLGEIIVGTDEDKGTVILGEFPTKHGKIKTIRLTTLQPATELQVERIEPPTMDYVKVKSLTKAGPLDWDLSVEAVPGCPAGKMPRNCAVIVKIVGKTSRNVRIPVRGLAFQQ